MFNGIGGFEMVLVGIIALMLFGSKLPEVARNLGGTYRGLKKNVDEFKREFQAVETYEPKQFRIEKQDEPESTTSSAPKFAPPSDSDNTDSDKTDSDK